MVSVSESIINNALQLKNGLLIADLNNTRAQYTTDAFKTISHALRAVLQAGPVAVCRLGAGGRGRNGVKLLEKGLSLFLFFCVCAALCLLPG